MPMRKLFVLWAILCMSSSCYSDRQAVNPVPFDRVELTGGFWEERMRTELDVTVPFSVEQSAPAVERFRRCADYLAGRSTELPEPHRFISSDLYKVMEGVAYSLMQERNPELEKFMDSTIHLIAASQLPDGYLYISHICGNPNVDEMGDRPYSWVVHSHELYNVGHLYEAAVAYYQATGKRNLLDVAIKNADHVNRVFFEGDPAYNGGKPVNQAPGHEEIELALCKLYRVTGNSKYLDMAKRFLDIRGVTYVPDGEGVMSPSYAQQHLPVREQRKPVGHAVRAAYLYTAMAQVDALTGRHDYEQALKSIWNNLVSTRMHITGGLGATEGIEGFGPEYYLPNKIAYNETCAAVANVFFNYGMFLAEKDAQYLDIAELSLFNNALAGISLGGNRFFYVNPLEADGRRKFNHGTGGRAEWFNCACCPPNISRLILQVAGYMYACSDDEIYLTLYGDSRTTIPLKGGDVGVEETSDYPFGGNVKVVLRPETPSCFKLKMRIPTWAGSSEFVPGGLYRYTDSRKDGAPEIRVNGEPVDYRMDRGFAVVDRKWTSGDEVELILPFEAAYVTCDSRVEDDRGAVAVVRGPLVYCAEEVDNGCRVQNLAVNRHEAPGAVSKFRGGIMDGIPFISVPGRRVATSGVEDTDIVMVPYYAWCNRGDDETMMVWMHDADCGLSRQSENSSDTLSASIRTIGPDYNVGNPDMECIVDGAIPASSTDAASGFWVSSRSQGEESLVLTFDTEVSLSSIGIYWMTCGDCRLPAKWRMEYRKDGSWKPLALYVTDSYGVEPDKLNVVHPAAVFSCDAIRLQVESGGGKFGVGEIILE